MKSEIQRCDLCGKVCNPDEIDTLNLSDGAFTGDVCNSCRGSLYSKLEKILVVLSMWKVSIPEGHIKTVLVLDKVLEGKGKSTAELTRA